MVDEYDDGRKITDDDRLKPSNLKEKPKRQTAVALQEQENKRRAPKITAAGRGVIAEQIIALAHENGINVREDANLVEILAQFELDSPIPSEAFGAVAEILSYVYRVNNRPNPFDTVLKDSDDTND